MCVMQKKEKEKRKKEDKTAQLQSAMFIFQELKIVESFW